MPLDFTVYPGSRIERLPRALQRPALVFRNALRRPPKQAAQFAFTADGMGTDHHLPFEADSEFNTLYDGMMRTWFGSPLDVRWRVWILTQCARQCSQHEGNFAEFGVYRGGYAFMVLSRAKLRREQRFFLFDTFEGIPDSHLTEQEAEEGFAGRLANTSVAYVSDYLKAWSDHIVIVEGDVFETFPRTETGLLSFCSLDLNASAPTAAALEYAYPRLVAGGMIVMDDYGFEGYEAQREIIDRFFQERGDFVLALPTGQALFVKR